MNKIIHLLSGGLDSTVLLYGLVSDGHQIHCALFNYGQKHKKELEFAHLHCHRLNIEFTQFLVGPVQGSELTDGKGTVVVPNRNAILLSLAINLAVSKGFDEVSYACNKDDQEMFPDCRPEFIRAINATTKAAGYDVKVIAPYIHFSKWKIGGLGQFLGVPVNETWSCYRGGIEPCGVCTACINRQNAIQ